MTTTTFKDKRNRDWTITVDVPFSRVAKKLGVDILDLKSDPIAKLSMDPLLLADFLWAQCSDQAKDAQVTQEDFEASLHGEHFEEAIKALKEAIIAFHPVSKHAAIRSQLEHNDTIQQQGDGVRVTTLQNGLPKIRDFMFRRADHELDRLLKEDEKVNGSP